MEKTERAAVQADSFPLHKSYDGTIGKCENYEKMKRGLEEPVCLSVLYFWPWLSWCRLFAAPEKKHIQAYFFAASNNLTLVVFFFQMGQQQQQQKVKEHEKINVWSRSTSNNIALPPPPPLLYCLHEKSNNSCLCELICRWHQVVCTNHVAYITTAVIIATLLLFFASSSSSSSSIFHLFLMWQVNIITAVIFTLFSSSLFSLLFSHHHCCWWCCEEGKKTTMYYYGVLKIWPLLNGITGQRQMYLIGFSLTTSHHQKENLKSSSSTPAFKCLSLQCHIIRLWSFSVRLRSFSEKGRFFH